ncbi:hypothetical protein [Streptomyces sp. NPDC000618]|uniref:hypothetical protein n=1 Tax=Streptomyces sp. NPDC000618 TaxID=3154265 RepID=UPI00331B5B18
MGGDAEIKPGRVAECVFRTRYDGVARPISFSMDPCHGLKAENASFLYQARDEIFLFLGRYDKVR